MHIQIETVRNMGCTVFSLSEEYPPRKPLQQGDVSPFKIKIRVVSVPGNNTCAIHIADSQSIINCTKPRLCTCSKTTSFGVLKEPKAAAAGAASAGQPAAATNGAPAAEEAGEQDPYAFLPKPSDNNKARCLSPHSAACHVFVQQGACETS